MKNLLHCSRFKGRFKNLTAKNISPLLSAETPNRRTGLWSEIRARLVIDTLQAFMASSDDHITTYHVPSSYQRAVQENRRAGEPLRVETLHIDHPVQMVGITLSNICLVYSNFKVIHPCALL